MYRQLAVHNTPLYTSSFFDEVPRRPTFVEDTAYNIHLSKTLQPAHEQTPPISTSHVRLLISFNTQCVMLWPQRHHLSETRGKPFSIGPRKPSFDFVWPCKSTSCERKCASDVNGIGPSIDVWYFCKVPIAADDLLQTDFDSCMCSDRNVRQCEVDCRST